MNPVAVWRDGMDGEVFTVRMRSMAESDKVNFLCYALPAASWALVEAVVEAARQVAALDTQDSPEAARLREAIQKMDEGGGA